MHEFSKMFLVDWLSHPYDGKHKKLNPFFLGSADWLPPADSAATGSQWENRVGK